MPNPFNEGGEPEYIALQRKLDGDRHRWRTVLRKIKPELEHWATISARKMSGLSDEPVTWRIVTDDRWQVCLVEFDSVGGSADA